MSGDVAVVGAAFAGGSGAAYVFQRNWGGTDKWGQVKKLTASIPHAWRRVAATSVAVEHGNRREGDGRGVSRLGAARTPARPTCFQRDEPVRNNWGEVKKLSAALPLSPAGGRVRATRGGERGDRRREGGRGGARGKAAARSSLQRDERVSDNWGRCRRSRLHAPCGRRARRGAAGAATSPSGADVADAGGSNAGAPTSSSRRAVSDNWGEAQTLRCSDAETSGSSAGAWRYQRPGRRSAIWERDWADAGLVFQPVSSP